MMGGLVLPAADDNPESEDEETQQDFDDFKKWLDSESIETPADGASATVAAPNELPATSSKPRTCHLCKKDAADCNLVAMHIGLQFC